MEKRNVMVCFGIIVLLTLVSTGRAQSKTDSVNYFDDYTVMPASK